MTTDRLDSIRAALDAHGQSHLLRFHAELAPAQQEALERQLQAIDFDALDTLIQTHVRARPDVAIPSNLEPAPYYPAEPDGSVDLEHYRQLGAELIAGGKVSAFTVAGGQGTRLGWRGPKGTYPASVVTGKSLFQCLAEQILAAEKAFRVTIPWYIMTSPENDAATRAFFLDNNCFGLVRKNIFMFPQAMMPAMDLQTGLILLDEKHRVAMSPDGHGGSIRALRASGAIEDMIARGIEHISYVQIDNPLVRVVDPLFIGLHAAAPDSSAEMSSKMVVKTDPAERVGVFCRHGQRMRVIEYSDLSEDLAAQTEPDGRLRFRAGSIAVHLLGVAFVGRLTEGSFALPYHRAEKIVPYLDTDSGQRVEPEAPNAVKLETFVFDALEFAASPIVLETSRLEEFAPIKNGQGADSPATCSQMQSDRHGAWLEQHGVAVPRDETGKVAARIEISPLTAVEAAELARVELPEHIAPGTALAL